MDQPGSRPSGQECGGFIRSEQIDGSREYRRQDFYAGLPFAAFAGSARGSPTAMNEIMPPPGLLSLARSAASRAHAPYSGYYVGAVLRSERGYDYVGCNVENASLPCGVCAERAALSAAVLAEGASLRMKRLVVVACDSAQRWLPVSPCGLCRQALAEFGGDLQVSFVRADGHWTTRPLQELLPEGFSLPAR